MFSYLVMNPNDWDRMAKDLARPSSSKLLLSRTGIKACKSLTVGPFTLELIALERIKFALLLENC